MENMGFYTIDEAYIDALAPYAPHLFRNAKPGQRNSRKYIGIVFRIGSYDYFAPLSSFKEKHKRMKNGLDFIKIKDYAVVNLNCMFPVPASMRHRVDFSKEPDARYRQLLLAEYREVKALQGRIRKNAANLYRHKSENGDSTKLAARCVDFATLEKVCDGFTESADEHPSA